MASIRLQQLSDELAEYPDQRGEVLLDIAYEHTQRGEHEQSEAIWRGLIADGGEDGDYARVSLAERLFDTGHDDAARAGLAALQATRRTDGGGWLMAAELFEARGELTEAHLWFTMMTSRFTEDDVTAATGELGWTTYPGMIVRGRRRVRNAIGLPADDTDRLLPPDDEIRSIVDRAMPSGDFADRTEALGKIEASRGRADARLLFWPRSEYHEARTRWPELMHPDLDEAMYFRKVEADLTELAGAGAPRVVAVPAEVDGFVSAGATADSAARHQYLQTQDRHGKGIAWPPGRNEPCWCGSDRKYKKCCGSPSQSRA